VVLQWRTVMAAGGPVGLGKTATPRDWEVKWHQKAGPLLLQRSPAGPSYGHAVPSSVELWWVS
jgi:hypothetical protein